MSDVIHGEWYKHYPARFIGGVAGLGPDVIGAYIVILDLIYQDGNSCPNDPRYLAGILGCSGRKVSGIIQVLIRRGKVTVVGDRLVNKTAQQVINERATQHRHLVDAGATGGRRSADARATSNKNKDLTQATLKQLDKNRIEKKESTAAAKAASLPLAFQFPTWWPKDAWDGFVAMRKKSRAPLTERAIASLVAELGRLRAAGGDPVAILDQSTQRAWRGIFPVKPDAKFGVIDGGGGIEHSSVVGWVTRLEIFHGLVEDSRVGSWLAKWGPPPGAAGCLVPKESLEVFQRRHPSKTARPAP